MEEFFAEWFLWSLPLKLLVGSCECRCICWSVPGDEDDSSQAIASLSSSSKAIFFDDATFLIKLSLPLPLPLPLPLTSFPELPSSFFLVTSHNSWRHFLFTSFFRYFLKIETSCACCKHLFLSSPSVLYFFKSFMNLCSQRCVDVLKIPPTTGMVWILSKMFL